MIILYSEVANKCYKTANFCYQWSNNRINHNFFCDGNFSCKLDSKHFIKGNVYLRSLTLEQFTELVTTSRVPSISDDQFLKSYNISKYSNNHWWIGRKIMALPMIIYDGIFALTASFILSILTVISIAGLYYIPPDIYALAATVVLIIAIFEGIILTRDDPEGTLFTRITTIIKKAPVLMTRILSKFCAVLNERHLSTSPSLINIWHLLIARLIILFSDTKGLKHFHCINLKNLFQAKDTKGKHLEREFILKTYCKRNNVDDEKRIELQVLLDNRMGKFRREKLSLLEEKEVSDNLEKFSKNQFKKNLVTWEKEDLFNKNQKKCEGERDYNKDPIQQEALALEHLLEPFFDLAKQFVHHQDQLIVLQSIADNLYELALSSQGERRIAIKQLFIRAMAQQILIDAVIKMNNAGYQEIWNDRVDLMLAGGATERRWEQLINPLLDTFNNMSGDLQDDEDLVEQAPCEIALVFFNSLKPNQKPALLNLLEKFPHLKRTIPNQEPPLVIKGFNHKILVHLLPHQPQWLLKKSELKKIFKIFLLCNRSNKANKKPFLNINMLWLVFSRIATNNYMGSNTRDLDQLAVQLRSASKEIK